MDTISRENTSLLPAVGVAVGAVALLLAAYSAINLSKVKQTLATHEEKLSHLDDLTSQVSAASAKADQLNSKLADIVKGTNDGFASVSTLIGTLQARVKTLEDSHVARGGHGHGGAVVAGPGEYVVRPGDTLAKIARANHCSVHELQSVNPGVDSKHLRVGQKLKLPEKAPADAAPAAAPAAPPAST